MESIDLLKGTGKALPLLSHHGDNLVVPSPGARLNGRGGIDVLGLRIGQGEDDFEVLTVPSIQQATDDLHVLLRHRLLPQPGGFEGFLLRLVERERGHLAVPNRDQPGASSLDFDAVASSKVPDVLHDQEAVLDLLQWVNELDPNFVECLEQPLPVRPDRIVPPKDACIEATGAGPIHHGVGCPVLQESVEVTAVVRVGTRRTISTFSCDIAYSVSREGEGRDNEIAIPHTAGWLAGRVGKNLDLSS